MDVNLAYKQMFFRPDYATELPSRPQKPHKKRRIASIYQVPGTHVIPHVLKATEPVWSALLSGP